MAEDYRGVQGGLPDLLLWRPEKGDAMLVEVKVSRAHDESYICVQSRHGLWYRTARNYSVN